MPVTVKQQNVMDQINGFFAAYQVRRGEQPERVNTRDTTLSEPFAYAEGYDSQI